VKARHNFDQSNPNALLRLVVEGIENPNTLSVSGTSEITPEESRTRTDPR